MLRKLLVRVVLIEPSLHKSKLRLIHRQLHANDIVVI